MKSRIVFDWLACGLAISVLSGGWSPERYLLEQNAEALYAEIEMLTADLSSTSDSDCGVIGLACSAPVGCIVYSRATTNESKLVEKVREYNEVLNAIQRQYNACFGLQLIPAGAISENGVCVVINQNVVLDSFRGSVTVGQ